MTESTNDSVWQLSEGRGDLHDAVGVLIASANEIHETRDVVKSVTGNTDDIDQIFQSVGTLVDTLTAKLPAGTPTPITPVDLMHITTIITTLSVEIDMKYDGDHTVDDISDEVTDAFARMDKIIKKYLDRGQEPTLDGNHLWVLANEREQWCERFMMDIKTNVNIECLFLTLEHMEESDND